MAGKRWLVYADDITYPANPDAPRSDWELRVAFVGQVVGDIPARSTDWLLKNGEITEAGVSTEPLPEDFPAREVLVAKGWKTVGQVERHAGELETVEGIGPATDTAIRAALLVLATTEPVPSEDGG